MCTNLAVFNYVMGCDNRMSSQRITDEEMMFREKMDAKIGELAFKELAPKVSPIVQQLEAFSDCEFEVYFKSHPQRGIAQIGGDIVLAYSVLNRPLVDIAQTLAHEWGHLVLGHVVNPYWLKRIEMDDDVAEQEADFYSGVFLGAAGYNLDEIINLNLELPDGHDHHGPRVKRVYYIACGYHHGVERKEMGLEGVPGVHVFGRSTLGTAMPDKVDNQLRKPGVHVFGRSALGTAMPEEVDNKLRN